MEQISKPEGGGTEIDELAIAARHLKKLDRQSRGKKKEDADGVFIVPPPVRFADLRAREFPGVPYLVDKFIIKKGINGITGDTMAGKTWFTLELAIQVASGGSFLGNFTCPTASPVLMVNEEDTERSMAARIKMLTDNDDLPIYFHLSTGVKLDMETATDQIVEQVKAHNIELVVLDNLAQLHTGEENSAQDMQRLITKLKDITRAGAGVVIVHHNRKAVQGQSSSARGSSSFPASLDTWINIERVNLPPDEQEGEGFIMAIEQKKNKEDSEVKGVVRARLRIVKGVSASLEYLGETTKEASGDEKLADAIYTFMSKGAPEEKFDKKMIMAEVSVPESTIDRVLKSLVVCKRLKKETRGKLGIKDGGNKAAMMYWITPILERQMNVFSDDFTELNNSLRGEGY